VKGDEEFLYSANDPSSQNGQAAIDCTARLDTILPSSEGTVFRIENGPEFRISNTYEDSRAGPSPAESRTQDSGIGFGPEPVSTMTFLPPVELYSNPPRNPSIEQHEELTTVEAALPPDSERNATSFAESGTGHRFVVPPTSFNARDSSRVEASSSFAGTNQARVNGSNLEQSASKLPENTNFLGGKVSSQKGESNEANVVMELPENMDGGQKQGKALHPLVSTMRRGNEERGGLEGLIQNLTEIGHTTFLGTTERQEDSLMSEMEELDAFKTMESPGSRTPEAASSPSQLMDLDVKVENEPGLDSQNGSEEPDAQEGPPSRGTESTSKSAELSYSNKANAPTGDNETGDRGGIDVVVDFPEGVNKREARREEEMEALYQVRLARRRENEEREGRRRLRREARERGDYVALRDIQARARPSSGASAGRIAEEVQANYERIKKERQRALSSVSYADAFGFREPRHESTSQVILDQSSAALEMSLNTVQDLSTSTALSLDHDEITSYGMQRFLESEENILQRKYTLPKSAHASDLSSREQEPHSKQRSKKRSKVPKIRRAKLDSSQKVDLTPAPEADKYWTYDEDAKAYYHIDSDTQSTFWYEESSEDSEG
jgi:hypothetical protein